jgi:hypothetical protein
MSASLRDSSPASRTAQDGTSETIRTEEIPTKALIKNVDSQSFSFPYLTFLTFLIGCLL